MIAIASFIVETLSLVATVILTVVIYRLQKKSEEKRSNERKEDIERQTKERNSEMARNFIIDNQSEIDFLPLAMIASNVKSLMMIQGWRTQRQYSHHIYLTFDKQPTAIKKEILKQESILVNLPENSDWVAKHLKMLKIDAFECGMSKDEHCYLYDNAKYFHRGLTSYGSDKLPESWQFLRFPDIPITRENSNSLFGPYTPDFTDYINELVFKKFGESSYINKNAMPPLDFVNFVLERDEKMFVLCIIQFIEFFSGSVSSRTNRDGWTGTSNDRQITTFEDYYYEALLALYLAYCPEEYPPEDNLS